MVMLLSVNAVAAQKGAAAPPTTTYGSQLSFFSGSTSVALSGDLVGALGSLNIGVRQLSNPPIVGGRVSFPITDGTIDADTLRGEIVHSNGLLFTRGDASVKIQSFIIDTTGDSAIITGLASANGDVLARIPLFDLDLSAATITRRGVNLQIRNVGVTLRPEAAGALNAIFETDAFVAGFPIGIADVGGRAFGG